MRKIDTNTLLDFKRYKDKMTRIVAFFSHSEQKLLTDNLSKLDGDVQPSLLLSAFEKDLNKTVDFISKTMILLGSVQDGKITALPDSPRVSDVFGASYDKVKNAVNLAGLSLPIGNTLYTEKPLVKDELLNKLLGIDQDTFKIYKKNIDSVFSKKHSDVNSESDAIQYLSQVPHRKKYNELMNKIQDLLSDFNDVRLEYFKNSESKNKYNLLNFVDREVLGTRAMVDSITKSSTHVSNDSVFQISKAHKKELKSLQEAMSKNAFLSDVEIDPDADISKVVDLLNQMDGLKLNLNSDYTFKVRKLGNYNASGLCLPAMNIVSVDLNSPSSLIHELTHLVDLTNKDIKNSQAREDLVLKYRSKLDLSESVGNKVDYYSSSAEIVARLGEISYILQKFNYQKGESISDFISRVRTEEKVDSNMVVVKSIDDYISSPGIYFGFGTDKLSGDDLLELKSYFESYWGVDKEPVFNNDFKVRSDFEKNVSKKIKKTARSSFEPTMFTYITEDTVIDSYDLSKTEGLIAPEIFVDKVVENMSLLHRTKKTIRGEEVHRQFRTVDSLLQKINESDDFKAKSSAITSLFKGMGLNKLYRASDASKFYSAVNKNGLDDNKELMDRDYHEVETWTSKDLKLDLKEPLLESYQYLNSLGQEIAKGYFSKNLYSLIDGLSNEEFDSYLQSMGKTSVEYHLASIIRGVSATKLKDGQHPYFNHVAEAYEIKDDASVERLAWLLERFSRDSLPDDLSGLLPASSLGRIKSGIQQGSQHKDVKDSNDISLNDSLKDVAPLFGYNNPTMRVAPKRLVEFLDQYDGSNKIRSSVSEKFKANEKNVLIMALEAPLEQAEVSSLKHSQHLIS